MLCSCSWLSGVQGVDRPRGGGRPSGGHLGCFRPRLCGRKSWVEGLGPLMKAGSPPWPRPSHRQLLGARAPRSLPSVSPVGTAIRRESPRPPPSQVYYLGEGEASRRWLQQEQNNKAKLCLSHVKAVASHVLARHPATTPLLWDDMLRGVPEDQLTGQLSGRDRASAKLCRLGRRQAHLLDLTQRAVPQRRVRHLGVRQRWV